MLDAALLATTSKSFAGHEVQLKQRGSTITPRRQQGPRGSTRTGPEGGAARQRRKRCQAGASVPSPLESPPGPTGRQPQRKRGTRPVQMLEQQLCGKSAPEVETQGPADRLASRRSARAPLEEQGRQAGARGYCSRYSIGVKQTRGSGQLAGHGCLQVSSKGGPIRRRILEPLGRERALDGCAGRRELTKRGRGCV